MPPMCLIRRWQKFGLRITGAVLLVAVIATCAFAREPTATVASEETQAAATGPELVINIPSFTLTYLRDGQVVKKYPVAVGKPSAPTPVGSYKIINKVVNPTWYPPTGGSPVPPGPSNPLGGRWMGFLPSGYGVHGNNNPSSIGKAVSLGCVRMRNEDVEELFPQIPVGTPLRIVYETMEVETDPLTGQTYLVFYPDIYRRGALSLEVVEARLRELGLAGSYTSEELRSALASSKRGASFVSLGMKIRVAGREEVVETVVVGGETLLAVRPVLSAFGLPVGWDATRRVVTSGSETIPVQLKGQRSFARLADLTERLGIKHYWNEEQKLLELYRWEITVNGEDLRTEVIGEGESVWLPAGAIAAALGAQVTWDPERSVIIGPAGAEWPAKLRGSTVFATADTLAKVLPIKITILPDSKQVAIGSTSVPVGAQGELTTGGTAPAESPHLPEAKDVEIGAPVRAWEEGLNPF